MAFLLKKLSIGDLITKYRPQIMGVASLFILFFHAWLPIFDSFKLASTMELFIKRVSFVGVDMFLFVSGFSLVFSINKNSLKSYYLRRIIKIYIPVLIFVSLLMLRREMSLIDVIKNITGFNFYTVCIYNLFWFVPALMTLYILFPLYYYLLKKVNLNYYVIGSILLWFILVIITKDITRTDLYGFINRIPIFIIGIYFGEKTYIKEEVEVRNYVLLLLVVIGITLQYLTNYKGIYLLVPESNCFLPNALFTIGFIPLVANVISNIEKFKLYRALTFLGKISFELYIVQEKLSKVLLNIFLENFNVVHVNIMYIMITICSAGILSLISSKISSLLLKRIN